MRGPQKLVHTPMFEILKKNPDRKTALIVGNIDVCPGRQTPSCRHWLTPKVTRERVFKQTFLVYA